MTAGSHHPDDILEAVVEQWNLLNPKSRQAGR